MPTSAAEPIVTVPHPRERQVLANIGNRYVVFGSQARIHGQRLLGPEDVKVRFAERIGDEMDFPPERLIKSIQVADAEVVRVLSEDKIEQSLNISFNNGAVITVDISLGTRDFKSNELNRHWDNIRELAKNSGTWHEAWNFNIDRLKLTILFVENGIPNFEDLEALYIWEFNNDGSIFDRTILDARLEDWGRRIEVVYEQVEKWAAREGLNSDRSRTILMSEEMMQRFGVPSRELSILDLSRDKTPIMSIVPSGLWIIGARGAIDVIAQDRSAILLDVSPKIGESNWVYLIRGSHGDPRPWDETAFRGLVGLDVHA